MEGSGVKGRGRRGEMMMMMLEQQVARHARGRVCVVLRARSTGLAASDVDATSRHDNLRNLKRRIGTTVRCTDHDQACRAGHPGLGKRCKKPFTTKKQKQGKAQNFKPLQVQIARIKSSFISVPRSAMRHKSLAKRELQEIHA